MRMYLLSFAMIISAVCSARAQSTYAAVDDRRSADEVSPLTLQVALDEALNRNPRLIVLRRQYEAMQHRPEQALALPPPSFEAQIWQWPINTLNARNTNMYMFTVGQSLPGFGKRDLRALVAEKDAELSLAAIAVEARDVIDQVKHVYAELFLARRDMDIHHANLNLLRQVVDVSEAKYVSGGSSQHDSLKAVVELSRLYEHFVLLGEQERLAQAHLNTLLDRAPDARVGVLMEPKEEGPTSAPCGPATTRSRPTRLAIGPAGRGTSGDGVGRGTRRDQAGLLREGRLHAHAEHARLVDRDDGDHLADRTVV